MKKSTLHLLVLGLATVIIASSCNKDKSSEGNQTYRVISETEHYDTTQTFAANYTYSNNKISKAVMVSGEENGEIIFSYPNENSITASYNIGDLTIPVEFTLEDGLITEFFMEDTQKQNYIYNSDKNIQSYTSFSFSDGIWEMDETTVFTYTDGKLVKTVTSSYGIETDMTVYSYEGDNISEVITSYLDQDGLWVDYDKSVLTYTAGKVSNIVLSYYYISDWFEDSQISFSYDKNGNLTKRSQVFSYYEGSYVTDYVYEAGSGNYGQIFGFIDYEIHDPRPNKKSAGHKGNPSIYPDFSAVSMIKSALRTR
ncbi:MAG: hypothetical protein H6540_05185 [Bacteroidales bacterium]|nr:hypothetical protein [Bacteroidales bacterium]